MENSNTLYKMNIMERTLTIDELRGMGFSDPWPSNTMSKRIQFKNGEIGSLQVWVDNGLATYAYFATPKNMQCKEPYEMLGIDYDGYYSGVTKDGSQRPKSIYPQLYSAKDIEDICFTLTGKSIYEIDIKENPQDRKEAEKWWNDLLNFGSRNKNKPEILKRKWYQFL